MHNILDKDGAATENYVVSYGSDNYAASVADDGTVTLNKTDITYSGGDITGATKDDTLIKVAANSDGEAVGFATVQGKNYEITDGVKTSPLLHQPILLRPLIWIRLMNLLGLPLLIHWHF